MLDPGIDWEAVASSDAFRELVHRRRRFTAAVVTAVMVFYGAFVIVVAAHAGVLGRHVGGPFTVGHVWAAAQIPFGWAVAMIYARTSRTTIDPLAETVRAQAATITAAAGTVGADAWDAQEVPA